jgi:hypothetical protein
MSISGSSELANTPQSSSQNVRLPSFPHLKALITNPSYKNPPRDIPNESLSWWLTEFLCHQIEIINRSKCPGRWQEESTKQFKSLILLSPAQRYKKLIQIEELCDRYFVDQPSESVFSLKKAKKKLKAEAEEEIGSGIVSLISDPQTRVQCIIKKTLTFSDVINKVVILFNAYVPGVEKRVGKCTFNFTVFGEGGKDGYATQAAAGILRLDSYARHIYRGVGSLLVASVREYGQLHRGTKGRVALHSEGEALGFYYKLGMRTLSDKCNRLIEEELQACHREHRSPHNISPEDCPFMYFPIKALRFWAEKSLENPVLHRLRRNVPSS